MWELLKLPDNEESAFACVKKGNGHAEDADGRKKLQDGN